MPFNLYYQRAEQAAATLLRFTQSRRMNVYRLLKLLYIADRMSLEESGRPIVGGRYIAMDRGPLHSTIYDLMKGCDIASPDWMTHFRRGEEHNVELADDPGVGALSKYDLEILSRVFDQFRDMDEWEVGDYTHKFAEFEKNKPQSGSMRDIPLTDILQAIGRAGDAQSILEDANDDAATDRFWSRLSSECGRDVSN